ncbi:MAG: anti-sigma regulatory factor [Pseudomonadota bacterium]
MTRHSIFTDRMEADTGAIRLSVQSDEELVMLRKHVRDLAIQLQLSLIDQTKLVTAASELARNALKYGGGGEALLDVVKDGMTQGVRLSLIDAGPGIVDLDKAMQDGYTSGGGMGLGLGGAKRLVDDFNIRTAPGSGTTVTITKWKK